MRRLARDGSIHPADRAVEIPEEANARQALADAPVALVGWIDAHAEEAGATIVEELTVVLDGPENCF